MDLKNQLKFLGLDGVNEIFATVGNTLSHSSDRSAKQGRMKRRKRMQMMQRGLDDTLTDASETRIFGHFMYLLRCVICRHSQGQTYRGTGPPATTLMSLPPKVRSGFTVDHVSLFAPFP
jgi:hypothetical protein